MPVSGEPTSFPQSSSFSFSTVSRERAKRSEATGGLFSKPSPLQRSKIDNEHEHDTIEEG